MSTRGAVSVSALQRARRMLMVTLTGVVAVTLAILGVTTAAHLRRPGAGASPVALAREPGPPPLAASDPGASPKTEAQPRAEGPAALAALVALAAPAAPGWTVAGVADVLEEHRRLYRTAGRLDLEEARALIARRAAAEEALAARLAALGPGGAAAIDAAMDGARSYRERELLIDALGRVTDPEAAGLLARRLATEESADVRRAILVALGVRCEPAARFALERELAAGADERCRLTALQSLASRKDVETASLAAAARGDESRLVRREAIAALGRTAGVESLAAVAGLAQGADADVTVRGAAIHELGRSFGEGALVPLHAVLADPNPAIRIEGVGALRRVRGERAADLLRRVAATDPDPHVRAAAVRALAGARAGDPGVSSR